MNQRVIQVYVILRKAFDCKFAHLLLVKFADVFTNDPYNLRFHFFDSKCKLLASSSYPLRYISNTDMRIVPSKLNPSEKCM